LNIGLLSPAAQSLYDFATSESIAMQAQFCFGLSFRLLQEGCLPWPDYSVFLKIL